MLMAGDKPFASFIHSDGVVAAVDWFCERFEQFVLNISWHTTRADLFADSHGLDLVSTDREYFLSRSRKNATYHEGEALTGFAFGQGGEISARIYDKRLRYRSRERAHGGRSCGGKTMTIRGQ